MYIKSIIAVFFITIPCFAADVMVERMQGVVNEVRELRERYEDAVYKNEACVSTLKEQEVLLMQKGLSPSTQIKHIEELEFENSKLNEALQAAKIQNKKYKKLQDDLQSLEKEKKRLNTSATILVEKNQSLLTQVNTFKRASNKIEDTKSAELLQEKEDLQNELAARKKKVEALEQVNKELVSKDKEQKRKIEDLLQDNKTLVKDLELSLNNEKLQGQKKVVASVKPVSLSPEYLALQKDNETLVKELALSQNRVHKNDEKLQSKTQVATSVKPVNLSTEYLALQKDNDTLLKELEACKKRPKRSVKKVQTSKDICVDDNPFPVLMKKKTITEPKAPLRDKPLTGVFRIKGESSIYNTVDGDVIEIWEDKRSFTSNVSKGDWIKITGFFINKIWTKANNALWVKKENTIPR